MSQVRTPPHQSHHVLINKSVHARSETKSVHQHKDHEREENKEKSMYGPGSRFFLDSDDRSWNTDEYTYLLETGGYADTPGNGPSQSRLTMFARWKIFIIISRSSFETLHIIILITVTFVRRK